MHIHLPISKYYASMRHHPGSMPRKDCADWNAKIDTTSYGYENEALSRYEYGDRNDRGGSLATMSS